jgi:hypothetical protein
MDCGVEQVVNPSQPVWEPQPNVTSETTWALLFMASASSVIPNNQLYLAYLVPCRYGITVLPLGLIGLRLMYVPDMWGKS